MIAPQDHDVRQSGTGLGVPILVIVREMPFKNYRGRLSENVKAREDKFEEARKQETSKNRDEDSNSPK